MKMRLASLFVLVICLATTSAFGQGAQPAASPAQPNVSPDEQAMANAVLTAPDPLVQLKAATDFIKKYPKSTLRPRVARELADQIAAVTDATQKVNGAQGYREIFKEPTEQEMITSILVEGMAQAKRTDEAFTIGSDFATKNPDSLLVLIQLVSVGTTEAKNKNGKFVPQSLQYGTRAIQLVEANQKPAGMDETVWASYKVQLLPSLYQSVGLLSLVKGDRDQARTNYKKAAELAPGEPFSMLMLAGILNDDYQTQAKAFQSMPAGPAKDAELKKIQALLDSVIEAYARAIAASEGNVTYQQIRQQYLTDLEAYYKYRHNNSTAGMQELIDKYKATPKP